MTQQSDAAQKITAYADRMERLLDHMDTLKADLKELKADARNDGFNVQALTKLVAIRRDKKKCESEEALLNDLLLYAHASGTAFDVIGPGA